MSPVDPFQLQRFVDAQATTYPDAARELQAGRKETHWMWFIFPQLRGLGSSTLAHRYGISSLEEAKSFAEHAILGPRLEDCTRLVNQIDGASSEDIFGWPDHLKFHSSMTLFALATGKPLFRHAIDKYFDSKPDIRTLQLIGP